MAFVFAGVMRQYLDERPALPGDVKYVLSAGDLQADFSNRERLMRWTTAWRMGLDRPIAGHGPGNFAPKFKHYLKTDAEVRQISYWFGWTGGAHSVWFTAFAETGAVGLLLLLGLLGAFLWRNGNTTRRGVWPAKAFADAQTRGFSGTNDIIPTPIQGPSKAAIVAIGFWAVAGIFNDLMLLAPLAGMLGMWFVPNGEDKVADADPSSDI
jgi:O-antigen ligase